MAMHGVRANYQALRDVHVAQTLRDKPEYLALAELSQHIASPLGRGRRRRSTRSAQQAAKATAVQPAAT